ncbi:hypothetical protein [Lawsonibacter sp. JLR.KK007]|uniref:hypothetical protein n=2 Tax=Bacteria TaxID=2 RepID=UPI002FF339C8
MKYFLLKTDPQFDTAPEIIDWFKRIDRRNICLGKSHNIEKRQLFFIKENSHTVFPDVLSFPFFMVTEALRDVIRMYEPKTIFKEIVLLGHKYAETCTYYLPILEYVDCLDPASKLTRDRSTILEGIISRRKVDDRSIFYLAEVRNLYTVARLDIVESFLRRGAKGLSLNEVKTVHEER